MIVAHLIYDKRSLLACSLTCYSWYYQDIAAAPHLHHTLITPTYYASMKGKFKWPKRSGTCTDLACFLWSQLSRSTEENPNSLADFRQNSSTVVSNATSSR